MAFPTFVAAGNLQFASSGSTLSNIPLPATRQENDIALMAVGRNASSNTTTPSGWNTIIASQSNSNLSTAFFWRRMTSSESNPSVTFGTSMSQSNAGGARIYLFRGCTTDGTPFEAPTGSGPTSNTSPSSATVDTTGPDRLVVSLAVMDNDTEAWVSGFPPSGWMSTGSLQSWNFSGDGSIDAITREVASASTVSAAVFGTTDWSGPNFWKTATLALIPAVTFQLDVPENVVVESTGVRTVRVTWDAVDGADSYQVRARVRAGTATEEE